MGQSWTTEGQTMTLKVTKLMETFLAATGMCILPCIIIECWLTVPEEIFQRNLDGVCATIVKCLDKVVTCQLSLTAWDMFVFPEAEEEHWQEDCLLYYPGKVVNIGARMPGICLIMQDGEG